MALSDRSEADDEEDLLEVEHEDREDDIEASESTSFESSVVAAAFFDFLFVFFDLLLLFWAF